jgi:hypothetical protein
MAIKPDNTPAKPVNSVALRFMDRSLKTNIGVECLQIFEAALYLNSKSSCNNSGNPSAVKVHQLMNVYPRRCRVGQVGASAGQELPVDANTG